MNLSKTQKILLALTSFNLVIVFLFPPFEYISNMTRAVIPTFEGFYFDTLYRSIFCADQ